MVVEPLLLLCRWCVLNEARNRGASYRSTRSRTVMSSGWFCFPGACPCLLSSVCMATGDDGRERTFFDSFLLRSPTLASKLILRFFTIPLTLMAVFSSLAVAVFFSSGTFFRKLNLRWCPFPVGCCDSSSDFFLAKGHKQYESGAEADNRVYVLEIIVAVDRFKGSASSLFDRCWDPFPRLSSSMPFACLCPNFSLQIRFIDEVDRSSIFCFVRLTVPGCHGISSLSYGKIPL